MRHTIDLLTLGARQAGTLHRRQLAPIGVDDRVVARHLRSGLLVEHATGVFRIVGVPATWEQTVWLALLTAAPNSVVSHRAAARLHRIGRFNASVVDLVEVGEHSNRVEGAAAHRTLLLPGHHRTTISGLPVTTVERTVFDLAGQVSRKRRIRGLPWLHEHQVARTLDDAIGRGIQAARFQVVLAELGGRGRGGTRVMRDLLSTRGEGYIATESELEDLLHEVLERHGMPIPVRQRNLGGLEERVGRVDFAYLAEGVVVEADGRQNHTALLDRGGDAWRDLELLAAGFRVIRVTWAQLRTDPRRFVQGLRLVLGLDRVR